jgi:hypothetical protein
MRDAIALGRPPSDWRFLLTQLAPHMSNLEQFEAEFWDHFFDIGDSDADVRRKLAALRGFRGGQSGVLEPDVGMSFALLKPEQMQIVSQIIDCVQDKDSQLPFLQGAAGTGKTFIVRAVIAELAKRGKKCLVTGTTGIAAAQYRGGTTLHSLFKLGIDDARVADFRSNIGWAPVRQITFCRRI